MSKKILKQPSDFLKYEPYKSIINILDIAPKRYKTFQGGLKQRQLMHLLVKDYRIKDPSDRKLNGFRKYLGTDEKLKESVLLDQKITGKYPHQGFYKYLQKLEKIGWITRGKHGRILLSTRYRFEPLKNWYNKLIMNYQSYGLFPYANSALFLKNIDDLQENEKINLFNLMDEHLNTYQKITYYRRKTGLRIAGDVWSKSVRKIEGSNELKLYFWIRLILIHYFATLSFDEIHGLYRLKENPHVDMDTIQRIKFAKFTPPFDLNGVLPSWQVDVFNFFEKAFWQYLSRLHISIDRSTFEKQVKLAKHDFDRLFERTLVKRAEAEFFISVVHPEKLSYFALKDIGGEDKQSASGVQESSIIAYEYEEKTPVTKKYEKTSFFDDSSFFDGFEEEIKSLEYFDEKDLSNQLRDLAKSFKSPVLNSPY